jgi:hypothetical protein
LTHRFRAYDFILAKAGLEAATFRRVDLMPNRSALREDAQCDAERAILEALETLRSPDVDSRQRSLAYAGYRQAVAALLPELERQVVVPDGNVHGKYFNRSFSPESLPLVDRMSR